MQTNQLMIKALVSALFLAQATMAAAEGPRGERPGRGKPPQEAIDACAATTQGDACVVVLREGNEHEGRCLQPPRMDELVCVPNRHNSHRRSESRDELSDSSTLR